MQKAAFVILICQTGQEEVGPGNFASTSPRHFLHTRVLWGQGADFLQFQWIVSLGSIVLCPLSQDNSKTQRGFKY